MNHKQKLGYILLGAGIMAFGITIGQVITPNIEAQNNGVFDYITCRGLTVVNKDGKEAIYLSSHVGSNRIILYNPDGKGVKETIALTTSGNRRGLSRRDTGISVYDTEGNLAIALSTWKSSISGEPISEVSVHGKDESGVGLYSRYDDSSSQVYVHDRHKKAGAFLTADETGGHVTLFDKHENPAIVLNAGEQNNEIVVCEKHQKQLPLTKWYRADNRAISLETSDDKNQIHLKGKAGKESINLLAVEDILGILILNRMGNAKWGAP